MEWDLPLSVNIDGIEYKIRDKCDYRVVLDCISALKDNELTESERIQCALFIFYENVDEIKDIEKACREMLKIINHGTDSDDSEDKPPLMNWEHDFKIIAPPVNRILNYDIRTPDKYTHWYTFLGAYMEIGECLFSNVVSIRAKRAKGIPLDKTDRTFAEENKKLIEIPIKLTAEEEAWLKADI